MKTFKNFFKFLCKFNIKFYKILKKFLLSKFLLNVDI